MKIFALLPFLLSFHAEAAETCGKDLAGGQEYTWCIDQDSTSKNPDVIYYLHGGGGTEKSGADIVARQFGAKWKEMGVDSPAVITFSFGPGWLLGDVATDQHPALLPLVIQEILPALEKKVGGLKGKRLILGHSMGGFNGAELSLRAPELFSRVALICPAVVDMNPFASDAEIEKYIAQQPATTNPKMVWHAVSWVRLDFQTAENWQRHDPFELVKNATNLPAYLLSVTEDDAWGFFSGSKRLSEILAAKTPTTWLPLKEGGHCAQSEETQRATAAFLVGK